MLRHLILIVFGIIVGFFFVFVATGHFPATPLRKHVIDFATGYEYRLTSSYRIKVPIRESASADNLRLHNGILEISPGFSWNGLTNAPDYHNCLRASLVHDALYVLMVDGNLPKHCRNQADDLFYKILREDGIRWPHAIFMYYTVHYFGGKFMRTDPVHWAPS